MTKQFKIPWEELSGHKSLDGKYKVSFIVELSEDDNISLTDIAHSISAGFEGHPVLHKLSNLDLEKTDKNGVPYNYSQLKAGTAVVVSQPVTLTAKIEESNGRLIIGAKKMKTEALGEMVVTIPAGTKARVNKKEANSVELIDFDSKILVPLEDVETGLIEDVPVQLNSIIFSDINIDHLMEDK